MERTWEERELPILEAVTRAQEAGEDIPGAARAAVPDVPEDVYKETLASLGDAGFLEVATMRNGVGRLEGARVKRITPDGRRQTSQWPSKDVSTELFAVLQARIDQADSEERSRLERFRDAAGDLSKSVVAAIVTAAVKGAAGLD